HFLHQRLLHVRDIRKAEKSAGFLRCALDIEFDFHGREYSAAAAKGKKKPFPEVPCRKLSETASDARGHITFFCGKPAGRHLTRPPEILVARTFTVKRAGLRMTFAIQQGGCFVIRPVIRPGIRGGVLQRPKGIMGAKKKTYDRQPGCRSSSRALGPD